MIRRLNEPADPWTPPRSAVFNAAGMARFAGSILMHFGSVENLLDVGAGAGRLGAVLGSSCGKYYAIDQVENDGVEVIDAHKLPAAWTGAFDVVVSKQTLPHFADPARAIAEMMRVAKRGVLIQQEFPSDGVGWAGHSLVHIDNPDDVLELLPGATFDGIDFVWRKP